MKLIKIKGGYTCKVRGVILNIRRVKRNFWNVYTCTWRGGEVLYVQGFTKLSQVRNWLSIISL